MGPPPPGIFTPVWAGGPAVVISVIMYETHILKLIYFNSRFLHGDGRVWGFAMSDACPRAASSPVRGWGWGCVSRGSPTRPRGPC